MLLWVVGNSSCPGLLVRVCESLLYPGYHQLLLWLHLLLLYPQYFHSSHIVFFLFLEYGGKVLYICKPFWLLYLKLQLSSAQQSLFPFPIYVFCSIYHHLTYFIFCLFCSYCIFSILQWKLSINRDFWRFLFPVFPNSRTVPRNEWKKWKNEWTNKWGFHFCLKPLPLVFDQKHMLTCNFPQAP